MSALNQTAVTVNWNPVTEANATGVSLLYGTTSNPVSATGVSFPVTASSGFVSLSPDSTYYFWVEGVNPYGSGPPTAPVSQSTYPAAVSLMPIGLAPDGTSRIINWTPQNSLSVTQYVIYREETAPIPSSWFAVTQFPGNVSLPVTLSMSLQPAVNYEEKVVAVNTTGTGPDSNYQPFSSLPLAPQAVTALSGISTASAAVSLSWADPSAAAEGVTLYTIYRSPSNAATNSYVSIGALPVPTLTPTFSYSDSSVTALGVYYYLIAAYADNEQTPLNTANAVGVTAFAAPNPPGAPTASPSNRTVALTWAATTVSTTYPVAGYNIYQSTSASVTGTLPVNATPVTSASFSVTGLVNGTTYYYWVGTVDSAGHPSDLSLSGPVSAEPLALPGAPGNMNAGGGNEAIQITWNPSTPGTLPIGGYQVFRSAAAPGGPYAPLTLLGANATGYVDDVPPLTIGTTYYYYVVAVDNSGITTGLDASADSVTVNGIPVTTAVNPPSGLLAAGGVSQVVLSWSDSFAGLGGPVTGYQIYRSTNPAATFTFLTTVAFGAGPVTDLAVANGTPYYYYFVAYSGGSASSDSATIFATPARPPSVPLGLAGVDGNASVTLGWTPNTPVDNVPVTQYVVYRDASAAITVYNAAATVDNTGLVNGNTYVYQIQAVNADGVTSGLSTPVADYPYILTAPAGLSSASGAASIVLSWTPPVTNSFPLGNYVLIRSLPGGGSPVTTSAASFPVTDTTVTQGSFTFIRSKPRTTKATWASYPAP